MPKDSDSSPNYRVRILTPHVGAENIEALKENKPFLMRAELELGAQFIQAVAVPTLVDMLGFSGSGGAPAYGFLVNEQETEREQVLFISLAPNTPIHLPVQGDGLGGMRIEDPDVRWAVLGITMALGALLTHFILKGPGIAKIIENADGNAIVVDMLDYEIPDMLKQKILPNRLEQMAPKP
jgi:hypothetical protein